MTMQWPLTPALWWQCFPVVSIGTSAWFLWEEMEVSVFIKRLEDIVDLDSSSSTSGSRITLQQRHLEPLMLSL